MDFRNYDHPNTSAPTLHVLDEAGRIILELVKLTKTYSTPEPPLGYEVWAYTENEDCPLGNVTYHATEETGPDARPWCFEPYWHRYRGEADKPAPIWAATMPTALATAWASGIEALTLSQEFETEQDYWEHREHLLAQNKAWCKKNREVGNASN